MQCTTTPEAVLISGPRGEHNHGSNAGRATQTNKLKVEAESHMLKLYLERNGYCQNQAFGRPT